MQAAILGGQGRTSVHRLDHRSRRDSERKLEWLRTKRGSAVEMIASDVRDPVAIARAIEGVEGIYHLATEVAAASSLADPMTQRGATLAVAR